MMTGITMPAVCLDAASALSSSQILSMQSSVRNPLFALTVLVYFLCATFGICDMFRRTLTSMLHVKPVPVREEPLPMKLSQLAPLITKLPSFRKENEEKAIDKSKSLPLDGTPCASLESCLSPRIQAFGRKTIAGEAVPANSIDEVKDLPDILAAALSDVEEKVQQKTSRFALRSFSSTRRNPCFAEIEQPSYISRARSASDDACPSPIESAFDTLRHSALDSALFVEDYDNESDLHEQSLLEDDAHTMRSVYNNVLVEQEDDQLEYHVQDKPEEDDESLGEAYEFLAPMPKAAADELATDELVHVAQQQACTQRLSASARLGASTRSSPSRTARSNMQLWVSALCDPLDA